MIFAPFAYKQQAVSSAPPVPFNPNDLTNLTFWVDMSDSNFYTTSGTDITAIYSKVGGSTNTTLTRVNASNAYYTLATSLSNGSLNSAKVTTRPTTYRSSTWNNGVATDATFGPKTNTTDYPDGSMFIVMNRGTISTAGYILSRYNNSTDRGVVYNLSTGSPNTDTIGYDFNSPAYQYYNTTGVANYIITRVNNGATSTIYAGSSQQATDSKNDTQNLLTRQFHNLGIYGSPTGTGDSTPVNEQYCEIIIYNRVLNSTELNQVWNYLSSKWNIALTDPDAVAFLTAAGITDPTISSAINTLVVDLKSQGLWSKMIAIYPFVGGTATTHKYNLKNPADTDAAFRLVFSGGITHSSTGIVGNGTNGYYDTFINASTTLSQNNVSMHVYVRNNVAEEKVDIGFLRTSGLVGLQINTRSSTDKIAYRCNNSGLVEVTNTDSRGFIGVSRSSSTTMVLSKNTTQTSSTTTSTTPPSYKIFGLCFNINNAAGFFSTREQAYSSLGTGLTDAELDTYYNIVQAFQTTLGRQV